MGNTNSITKNILSNKNSTFKNKQSEEYQTINQLQQIIQFTSFQILFQSTKHETPPEQLFHKIKGKSNIINIIFSQE